VACYSKSAFAPYIPAHGRIPSAASIQDGFPKYTSSDLVDNIQQNPAVDLQYHGFLMSNILPVKLNDGAFSMELSKSGHAPWSEINSDFLNPDQFTLEECFNTNVTFRRDFHNSATFDWTSTHLTSVLVPAWVCITVCNSQLVQRENPRSYFKYNGASESFEVNDIWTRYGFHYRCRFSNMEQSAFPKGTHFTLLCDHNYQTLHYKIDGSFNRNFVSNFTDL
jgi:hypothetical protein